MQKHRVKSTYSINDNGDVVVAMVIPIEGLSTHKRRQALFDSVDELLDCLNDVQEDIGLFPDSLDIRDDSDDDQ